MRIEEKATAVAESKPCGECTACCTIMRVDALDKPIYYPCQHICANGCAIYKNKPKECDVWECAWQSGWIEGDERRRPDKLGVMFEFRLLAGRAFLFAYEVWEDAFERDNVRYFLGRLETKYDLLKCAFGSMKITGDPEILDFLNRNGCGSHDVPLVPSMPLLNENGAVIGFQITRKEGENFEIKQMPLTTDSSSFPS